MSEKEKQGTTVFLHAKSTLPDIFLETCLLHNNVVGIAAAASDGSSVQLMRDPISAYGDMKGGALQALKDTLEAFKDRDILLCFQQLPEGFKPDHIAPYPALVDSDNEPLVVAALHGEYHGDIPENDLVDSQLAPALHDQWTLAGQKWEGFAERLKSHRVAVQLGAFGKDGSMLALMTAHEPLGCFIVGDQVGTDYPDWGWATNSYDYTEGGKKDTKEQVSPKSDKPPTDPEGWKKFLPANYSKIPPSAQKSLEKSARKKWEQEGGTADADPPARNVTPATVAETTPINTNKTSVPPIQTTGKVDKVTVYCARGKADETKPPEGHRWVFPPADVKNAAIKDFYKARSVDGRYPAHYKDRPGISVLEATTAIADKLAAAASAKPKDTATHVLPKNETAAVAAGFLSAESKQRVEKWKENVKTVALVDPRGDNIMDPAFAKRLEDRAPNWEDSTTMPIWSTSHLDREELKALRIKDGEAYDLLLFSWRNEAFRFARELYLLKGQATEKDDMEGLPANFSTLPKHVQETMKRNRDKKRTAMVG